MIILLNGATSSGKTSIVRAIQDMSDRMWMQLGIDVFIDMVHTKFWGNGAKASEGFLFTQSKNEKGQFVTEIISSPMGKKLAESIPDTVALLANRGLDVIIDECLFDNEIERYKETLQNHDICYVGVMCDLETLEQREKDRGDRILGAARWMFDKLHKTKYDLTVDTDKMSPMECAQRILEFVEKNNTGDVNHD